MRKKRPPPTWRAGKAAGVGGWEGAPLLFVPTEGGRSGQRRTSFSHQQQDRLWEMAPRRGPSLGLPGPTPRAVCGLHERSTHRDSAVLSWRRHAQLHRLRTAQHQELCSLSLRDPPCSPRDSVCQQPHAKARLAGGGQSRLGCCVEKLHRSP